MTTDTIQPAFKGNRNAIAMSCSDEYAPYLSVYLTSILENSSKNNYYDIVVFERSITDRRKEQITQMFNKSNFSVRFTNPEHLFENKNLYISHSYFKKECYYRLVAPILLNQYDKILFTDIDLIVKDDIYDIFKTNLKKNTIAATIEIMWRELYDDNRIIAGQNIKYYTDCVLRLKRPYEYYNTGVMLIDVQKYNRKNAFEKIIKDVTNSKYIYQEQCALNKYFRNNIVRLPNEWNHELADSVVNQKKEHYIDYQENMKRAKILHFLGGKKPWFYPVAEFSEIWWNYARKTPFYEECLWRAKHLEVIHQKNDSQKALEVNISKIRNELTKVHFTNINNHFAKNERELKLLFVMDHMLSFRLKRFYYRIKKAFSFGSRYEKYNAKYNSVKALIKDAKKMKKDLFKV